MKKSIAEQWVKDKFGTGFKSHGNANKKSESKKETIRFTCQTPDCPFRFKLQQQDLGSEMYIIKFPTHDYNHNHSTEAHGIDSRGLHPIVEEIVDAILQHKDKYGRHLKLGASEIAKRVMDDSRYK
jgi:hypothetical protein